VDGHAEETPAAKNHCPHCGEPLEAVKVEYVVTYEADIRDDGTPDYDTERKISGEDFDGLRCPHCEEPIEDWKQTFAVKSGE
jgi:uncharacterized protein with PIN domain